MTVKQYKLLIVESPSKAKTIGKYLGDEYVVRASVGHVRDLPKSNKQAIDIPGGFIPHYEISKGKEEVRQTPTVKVKRLHGISKKRAGSKNRNASSFTKSQRMRLKRRSSIRA